ncbi:restriction endonuclease subunit S [Vreelandella sulfidaeris]|uniref:restriction endonuclease subunit S n=1 Tax=Vreelandella sulfidaeris TaxID=115553 RepID=UPI0035EEFC01
MTAAKNIPTGWVQCSLADVITLNPKNEANAEQVAGFVPMALAPTCYHGTLHFEEKLWGEIKKSYTNFADGDVIFAKVTPCFENGKASVVSGMPNGIGAGSSEFYVLRPASINISSTLIFALIKSQPFMQQGAQNMTGAVGLRRVPRAFVEAFPIALPPVAEQKVIADKLDSLLAQVENTKARLERIPEILKRFRQSVLAAAVSGRLTREWRLTGQNIEITDRYSVPSDWTPIKLDKLSNFVTSGSRGWAKYYSDEGSLFIRSQDINTDELNVSDPCYVSLPNNIEGQRTKVQESDLLLTITGANVTKCARVKKAIDNAFVSQHVSLIRLKDPSIACFVELVLKAPNAGRHQLLKAAYGGGKPGLNLQNIKNVSLALPEPDEMAAAIRRVDQLFAYADRIEQQVSQALTRVNNLTQSILAKAFRGELTAQWRTHNPELISGENSAKALLERIKEERATQAPIKRTRKKATA